MVIAIAAIVVVSTLAAMGFVISGNGSIEQSGLMQLHTLPTGASVKVDGNAIFARTNLSRTLAAGEHTLEIYRDNYDTWSKTITVRSGVLIRLYYPRLFLQNRLPEAVQTLTEKALEFYAPSGSGNYILYADNDASEWKLADIRGDEVKITPLDLAGILPGMVEDEPLVKNYRELTKHTYTFKGTVVEVRWAGNEESVLVKVKYNDNLEWVLVRLKDIAQSMNLTRTFSLSNEADLTMIDSAASRMYVFEKRQLRRISTGDGVMSRVLLDNVLSYAAYGTNVAYIAGDSEGKHRAVGVYRDDEKAGTIVTEVPDGAAVRIALSNYYGDDYVAWTVDNKLNVLYGRLPNFNENEANLSELTALFEEEVTLAETPESLKVSPGGEFFVAQKGQRLAVVDLEMNNLSEYNATTADWRWFDASMMYAVQDGQIVVWDFDGQNRRNLAESLAEDAKKYGVANQPIVVTGNNRWLYYLTTDEQGTSLIREKIRE